MVSFRKRVCADFFNMIFLGNASGSAGNFFNWDLNEDGVITRDEVNPREYPLLS